MTDIRAIYNELYALLESGGLRKTLKAFKKESGFKPDCDETQTDASSFQSLADAAISAIIGTRASCVKLNQENGTNDHHISRAKKIVLKHKKKRAVESQSSETLALPVESDRAASDQELRDAISPFVSAIQEHYTASPTSQPNEEDKPGASPSPSHRRKKRPRISETAMTIVSEEDQSVAKDSAPNGLHSGVGEGTFKHVDVPDAAAVSHGQQRRSSVNSQNGHSFKRIDESKFLKTIRDARLLDQSYKAKGGDAFASRAAEELGRVRGKDFKKEMHKKKRASWKGAGVIEDTVNSIQFEDSD